MSHDVITGRDVLRQIPSVLSRFPSILKGYYYYALRNNTKPLSIGSVIEDLALKQPERTAILFEDRRISYGEFNAWANRFAHYFRTRGIAKGDAVALFVENRPELLAALVGASKLGAGCAMINTSQRGKVLEHSLNLIRPKLFVVGGELTEAFNDIRPHLVSDGPKNALFLADTDTLSDFGSAPEGYLNLAELISHYRGDNPTITDPARLGDTAVYLFTSGTTGMPKATPCNHKKFFRAYGGFGHMSLGMKPDDVMYVTLPFYHGTALLVCWGSVLAGGSALAMRRKFSASAFWDDIRKYNATTFGYVGELCRYLLNMPPSSNDRSHPLRKMVGNGLRPSIWREFKERFGIEQIAELYGSSEGNIGFSNFLNLDNTVGFSTAPFALAKYHEGTRDPVRNAKGFMEKVGKGEAGLLLGEITKKWSFEGYTQKEATDKAVLRDVFKKGDAWFNTGDLLREIGCRHLQFVDRMGDTFRWKGENVSTTEVENMFDEFDGIEEAIVYGVEIPDTNGRAGMATLVLSNRRQPFDLDGLSAMFRKNLPAYAIPVFLRVTNEIEKTGTFKYKKVDLKNRGYALDAPEDSVYVLLPGSNTYTELTPEIVDGINGGQYRF